MLSYSQTAGEWKDNDGSVFLTGCYAGIGGSKNNPAAQMMRNAVVGPFEIPTALSHLTSASGFACGTMAAWDKMALEFCSICHECVAYTLFRFLVSWEHAVSFWWSAGSIFHGISSRARRGKLGACHGNSGRPVFRWQGSSRFLSVSQLKLGMDCLR